jgi:translation initiation factor RLI1
VWPASLPILCQPPPSAIPQVTDRNVENLSGGELQRFAIAAVALQEANVYMIDEPSSYLDVRQRLKAAKVRWHLNPYPVFERKGRFDR